MEAMDESHEMEAMRFLSFANSSTTGTLDCALRHGCFHWDFVPTPSNYDSVLPTPNPPRPRASLSESLPIPANPIRPIAQAARCSFSLENATQPPTC
ncbi:hypothetical protein EI94DRAFT_1743953 [Lactarius quietus]|nr:hypothetical protein EI94DRAFT_1743953 [Lactarius quietus]